MDYDVCVIGAGWAGFNAAVFAAKLGKKACLIEAQDIGGTCLNRGCIPTKSLVYNSRKNIPWTEIQKKKDEVVSRLKSGMTFMVKKHAIDFVEARAKIEEPHRVSLSTGSSVSAKFILIAAGSAPKGLPLLAIDHKRVVSSDDVLNWQEVPKSVLIVGGGVIGCEFASILQRLGCEVTIVEAAGQLLPGFDIDASKRLKTIFEKSGIKVFLSADVNGFKTGEYEKILLAVGRKPVTDGVWAQDLRIAVEKCAVGADRYLKTNVNGVFAAGDCVGGYMLAHVAGYEGELAVSNMFSRPEARDYSAIPSSVFTFPEVAAIGINEEEAKNFGCDYKAATVHFLSVGMSHIFDQTQGFVKVIVDVKTSRILGASIIGCEASELVNFFSVFMKNNISVKDLRKTIFAHPSISEIIAEVAKSF